MMDRLSSPRRKTLAAILLLLLMATYFYAGYLPARVIEPVANPNLETPAAVGLAFESFTVSPAGDDLALQGWWMPAASPRAAMLFVHGAGSNRTSGFFRALDFYRALVERGISVAAVDLRNHGESDHDDSGLQFGRSEQGDVLAALAWIADREPTLPRFATGISMGGAAVIRAAASGAAIEGLILVDPLLHTESAITQGVWVNSGLPATLFTPGALAAVHLHGLPGGAENAGEIAASLDLPILLIQDPMDPVTLAIHARELAHRNPRVRLWEAPPASNDDPRLAWKGRWGTHVAAFDLFPDATLTVIEEFLAHRGI